MNGLTDTIYLNEISIIDRALDCANDGISVQVRECKDNSNMPAMHYHEAYEVYILVKGTRTYVFEDEIVELKKNDVVLVKPNKLHATRGGGYKRYLLYFNDKFLKKYFTEESRRIILHCFEHKKVHLRDIEIESVVTSLEKLSENPNSVMEFVNVLRILNTNSDFEVIECKNKTAEEIIEYVARNYDSNENLDEIADGFYITKSYLCRLFKENTGISVIKYINSKKALDACEMLVSTNKSIDEIAALSGFNSSEYFCRIFKSVTGTTPGGYRKSRR